MSRRLLVVDDDASIRETFEHHLSRSGWEVETAATANEALDRVPTFAPDVVVTDVRMPGMTGLELLERISAAELQIDVIVITAFDDMSSAVAAMKAGAFDYLVKPLDLDHIDLVLARCLRQRRLRRPAGQLGASPLAGGDELVGRDARMVEIYKVIGSVADTRTTVLIRGETGTGKERIARAVHSHSGQTGEPFVAVNCTALSETLLESELFGHVRGAFTGAVAGRRGMFELAGAGTIFLDEIGDTSPAFQAKLLRVLEDREFYPVGAERPRRTEARVIAATHRPVEELVAGGKFREDLYFRLRVVEIRVPPLRDRRGDIPLLVGHALTRIARELHREHLAVSPQAMRLLEGYAWPGNVRELENALTRAAVYARGGTIAPEHLLLDAPARPTDRPAPPDETLEAVERAHVEHVLRRTGGNKRQAARVLGVSRPRLDRLIEKYGLTVTLRQRDGIEA